MTYKFEMKQTNDYFEEKIIFLKSMLSFIKKAKRQDRLWQKDQKPFL